MKLYNSGVYLVNGRDIVEELEIRSRYLEKMQPEIQWHTASWKHTTFLETCRNFRSNLTNSLLMILPL